MTATVCTFVSRRAGALGRLKIVGLHNLRSPPALHYTPEPSWTGEALDAVTTSPLVHRLLQQPLILGLGIIVGALHVTLFGQPDPIDLLVEAALHRANQPVRRRP